MPVTIKIYGEIYECSRAARGANFVRLYDKNNNCIASFNGITNFEGYEIIDGEWEFIVL